MFVAFVVVLVVAALLAGISLGELIMRLDSTFH
jgi:hypothetical protein